MKKLALPLTILSLAVSSAVVSTSASAESEVSANVGVVSQYFFRGIQQTETATASAGVDLENGGFYLGTWAADVEDGLEVDFYAGYGFEFDNGLGLSVGYTTYQYTGDFDSAYNEFNFGLSYGLFSVEYSIGEHDDEADLGITSSDYTFLALTIEKDGYYGTYGNHGDDFDGNYLELGYGTEVSGVDLGVSLISASSSLTGDDREESLVFSLGKSF